MSHHASQPDMNLLIVDDDRSIRTLITKVASSWGYKTEECDSAETALVRLQKMRFNIVITDINMGKMDGITFAEKLRETMPSTAVMIMTGFPSPKTAKKSQDMGAIYYMQKPLDLNDLGNTLKIAAGWNIGMLIERASRRFLALHKGPEPDQGSRMKAIKQAVKKLLASPGWMEHLRNFVYAPNIETNALYAELTKHFSADSVQSP